MKRFFAWLVRKPIWVSAVFSAVAALAFCAAYTTLEVFTK